MAHRVLRRLLRRVGLPLINLGNPSFFEFSKVKHLSIWNIRKTMGFQDWPHINLTFWHVGSLDFCDV